MGQTRGTRVERPAPNTVDAQVETVTGEVFEVLVEQPNGHRTVVRVRAADWAAAEQAVVDGLDDGVRVIGVAVAGAGLGSG